MTEPQPNPAEPGPSAENVLIVTEKARAKVLAIRAEDPTSEELALWVEIVGAATSEYSYDLYFESVDKAGADDVVAHHDDMVLVVPAGSIEKLKGATLDLSRDLLNPGLVIHNPNRPPAPAMPASPPISDRPPADLTGDVAQRVATVLEEQINPSIAAHGGHATLVAVEEDTAYLRLGGGCVGCGMASVTLGQGIEVAIREAVPEITNVVDVTDHASGTNPFYEAAKK